LAIAEAPLSKNRPSRRQKRKRDEAQLSISSRAFPATLHPPLTEVTIGLYTGATSFGVLSALGVSEVNLATAWWLALVGGLIATVPTALAGLLDWLGITRGTPLFRTATLHLVSIVTATVFFLIAAIAGHGDYVDRAVGAWPLVLTLIGFGFLTLGGWLGGAVVFTHRYRVLSLWPSQRIVQ
jgi:uncharacterized membrane protein